MRSTFPISKIRSNKIFPLLRFDTWGPSGISTMNDYRYFITFIDDYFYNTFVYLMHMRSEAFHIIQNFFTFVEKQYQAHVYIFRSDNVKEYASCQTHVLQDLEMVIDESMHLCHDNKAVINLANDPILYETTKHVEIDHHFI